MIETLRRTIRSVVGGPTSPIYRAASQTLNAVQISRQEGFARARALRQMARSAGAPQEIRLRALAHPITVRPGSDDITTIVNNVVREEYAQHLPRNWMPRGMIDAGGHIGDTSAYFASRYPNLEIITLEPQKDNFLLAKRNLQPYGARIQLLDKALAGHAGHVEFGGADTGGSLGMAGSLVETITVADALAHLPNRRVDLLKMDIEGAELDVIQTDPQAWLPRVDVIVAELHGPVITRRVVDILGSHGFGAKGHRSLTFFRRGW